MEVHNGHFQQCYWSTDTEVSELQNLPGLAPPFFTEPEEDKHTVCVCPHSSSVMWRSMEVTHRTIFFSQFAYLHEQTQKPVEFLVPEPYLQ